MIYKFLDADGKEIGSTLCPDLISAKQYAKEVDIPWVTIDICEDEVKDATSTVENTTKVRKPRADKGTKRINVNMEALNSTTSTEDLNKTSQLVNGEKPKKISKVEKDTRRRPEYFLSINNILQATPLTHDKATKVIEGLDSTDTVRVIMGHEIKFTRKVQFHF